MFWNVVFCKCISFTNNRCNRTALHLWTESSTGSLCWTDSCFLLFIEEMFPVSFIFLNTTVRSWTTVEKQDCLINEVTLAVLCHNLCLYSGHTNRLDRHTLYTVAVFKLREHGSFSTARTPFPLIWALNSRIMHAVEFVLLYAKSLENLLGVKAIDIEHVKFIYTTVISGVVMAAK